MSRSHNVRTRDVSLLFSRDSCYASRSKVSDPLQHWRLLSGMWGKLLTVPSRGSPTSDENQSQGLTEIIFISTHQHFHGRYYSGEKTDCGSKTCKTSAAHAHPPTIGCRCPTVRGSSISSLANAVADEGISHLPYPPVLVIVDRNREETGAEYVPDEASRLSITAVNTERTPSERGQWALRRWALRYRLPPAPPCELCFLS